MSLRLPAGIRRLFRLPFSIHRARRDLDDEVRFHLEMRAEALRGRGLSAADAEREALARFGDPAELHEYSRTVILPRRRRRGMLETARSFGQDLRFGVRQLRRAPGFAATAIIVCALGVGANTALFSVVHRLILEPLPFVNGARMVMLEWTTNNGAFFVSPTQRMIDRWAGAARAVDHITVIDDRSIVLGDTAADSPAKGYGVATVPRAMAFVHASPALGRNVVGDDTLPDAPPVALISHGLWERQFGGTTDVLGKAILVDGAPRVIVGVLPAGFALPLISGAAREIDVLEPLRHSGADRRIAAIAMLRPGFSARDAARELAVLFPVTPSGAKRAPTDEHGNPLDVPRVRTGEDLIGTGYRQIVIMLFGAVGFVLVIACANVANLILSRAWSRQREFAVRRALGAGRGRLVRQMITESLTLAAAGGALGVGVAAASLRIMVAVQPPNSTELNGAHLEPAVLAWSLGVAILTGLLFGLAPALFASGDAVSNSLKSASRTAAGTGNAGRVRAGLVILEIALSVTLLAGAGLLVRTLLAMERYDVGFEPRKLAGIPIPLGGKRYADLTVRRSILEALIERVRTTAGVEGAAFALMLPPGSGISMAHLEVEGVVAAETDSLKFVGLQYATPEYFKVAGIRVLQGRVFAANASLSDKLASDEVMVSESFAKRLWPGASPLGRRLRLGVLDWSRIVGIVPDVQPPGGLRGNRGLQIYGALPPAPAYPMLVVRGSLSPLELSAVLRRAAHEVDPSLKLRRDAVTAEAEVAHFLSVHRFVLALLGGFATLALVLAAIGLYGVIAYSVSQRTREMGVRIALGARSADVVGMVLREAMSLSVLGIVVGGVGAVAATRALRGLLFGVQPGDPTTLAATAFLLAAVAIGAAYLPARRAASIDPIEALRAE
jgi:predicted permease